MSNKEASHLAYLLRRLAERLEESPVETLEFLGLSQDATTLRTQPTSTNRSANPNACATKNPPASSARLPLKPITYFHGNKRSRQKLEAQLKKLTIPQLHSIAERSPINRVLNIPKKTRKTEIISLIADVVAQSSPRDVMAEQ